MSIEKQLLEHVRLSDDDKKLLSMIERNAVDSKTRRILHVIAATSFPLLLLLVYTYVLNHLPDRGLALCKLRGPFYIPEPGALEELLRIPLGFLCTTVFVWVWGVYYIQSWNQRVYRIIFQITRRSSDA